MTFRQNRIKPILSDPCSREYFRLVYLLVSVLCHKDVIMNSVRAKVFLVFLLLTMFSPLASADTPVWTFTPDPSFPNTVTLDINSTALVKYTVTNNSGKPHTLAMKPMKGIVPTVSGCSSSCSSSSDTLCLPTRGSTCLLTLTLNGRQLQGAELVGGPWLCQTLPWGTLSSQCYGPSLQDSLAINLTKDDQTITFNNPPSSAAVGTTYTPTATSTSGLPVTITVDPASNGSCSISGGVVSFVHVGYNCILDANQSGNSFYNPAPQVQTTISVSQGSQTVSFTSTPPEAPAVGGTYTATASASSGLTVDISRTAGPCTLGNPSVSNGVTTTLVTFNSVGNCIISATQGGNSDYSQATQAQQSLAIKISQTITWVTTAPTNAKVGGTPYTPAATSTSGEAVTFTVNPTTPTICSISNGIVSFQAVGTCTLNANQAGNQSYNPAPQVQQIFLVGEGSQTVITEVSTSQNPIEIGTSITLTANLSSNNNIPPAGKVSFYDAYYGPLAQCQDLNVTNGAASCSPIFTTSTDTLHAITASFYRNGILSSVSPVLYQYIMPQSSTTTTPPAGPINVTAIPGDGQVTLNWFSPTNTGARPIKGYTVTYGTYNSGTPTNFLFTGCIVNSTSSTLAPTTCNIVYLQNQSTYVFKVTPRYNTTEDLGPISGYSSPITPSAALTASTPTLALSGLGSGQKRAVVVKNNSVLPVTITAVSAPAPALPLPAAIIDFPTSCRVNQTLISGASCTLTIDPGSSPTSSGDCTIGSGSAPTPSTITLTYTTNGNTGTLPINVAILGYGCIYQGGYLFSIDDTTPINGSIGGKVVTQSSGNNRYAWSVGSFDVRGVSDTSTIAVAYPQNALTSALNCNGINDGACDLYNILLYGSQSSLPSTNVPAAYQCSLTIEGYIDWYLPSLCEWVPYSTCVSTTNPQGVQNIQTNLYSSQHGSFGTNNGPYWSSTEYSVDATRSWEVILSDASGRVALKSTERSVRCARSLTL